MSTYIANIIGLILCIKILLSIFKTLKSSCSRILVKNNYYYLEACFRLYKALFNLQTRLLKSLFKIALLIKSIKVLSVISFKASFKIYSSKPIGNYI